ncbi:L,D-transpeptidase family protein [soil metagenome]
MKSCLLAGIAAVISYLAATTEGSPLDASLTRSRQLIVVTAEDWNSDRGVLQLLERAAGGQWQGVGEEVPVMLGRNGLAWGIGLRPPPHKATAGGARRVKQEGDGRSPAGVFELERVWGGAGARRLRRFPYRQMSAVMEGIDDSRSRFYNRFLDVTQVPDRERDWKRTETVRAANPMFRWLVEVKHNWAQRPDYGSNIWLHIWKAPCVATSGCTAMEAPALERLVHWLETRKRPLLVQLPRAEMERLLPQIGRE